MRESQVTDKPNCYSVNVGALEALQQLDKFMKKSKIEYIFTGFDLT